MSYDRTIPYNDLPLLPPDSKFLDGEILKRWGMAVRALAELNKNILRLPNPSMLVNTISIQEAKSSSEIENIFTTEDELYKAISDSVNEHDANPNTREVLRYREALWAGFSSMKKKKKIDSDIIVKIYQKIKNTKQGIRPPHSQIVIKRGNSELRPGSVIYTPPRGKGVLEKKIKNLIQYLNEEDFEIDPLIKMAIAHFQFEAIHPFDDGNGRTGRILNLLYLIHSGLISHPVLYMSKYIIQNKEEYYHTLGSVAPRQSWKPWILYMMTAVEQTAQQTNRIIDEIIDQMEATMKHGKKHIKWYNKEVNEIIFSQPYIKAKAIGKVLGRKSRTTITNDMAALVKAKILTKKESGKEVFYLNNDLIRIMEE